MNRRDIFKGLLAVPVVTVIYDKARCTAKTGIAPAPSTRKQGPYDTDDVEYDEWLDRHDEMHL